jgi:selenocysteine lyase/cysteine desulfurase
VEAIGCDMLSATGRKFLRGPRATGFLYVRRSVLERLEPPFVDLHAADWTARDRYAWRPDARRFESWETNFATKIGLAAAVDYALTWGMDRISARTTALAEALRRRLAGIRGVTVCDRGVSRSGIVTFTVDGRDPRDLKLRLRERRMNVTVSEGNIARLDYEARGLERTVRASPHYYNTDAEIERFAEAVAGLR